MMSMSLLLDNKVASAGAAAIVTGVVLLLSATAIDTGDYDDGSETQSANIKKKKTLLALGGSMMSIGVLAQVYDRYTRSKSSSRSSYSPSKYLSSSEMSPAELSKFQDRVSAAAAKLRKSIARASEDGMRGSSSRLATESAAELAARASAQISSFIQNYS